jgi:hypothetical protein
MIYNIRMKDSTSALAVLGVLLLVVVMKRFSFSLLELLLKLTRPGATVLLLSVVGLLFMKNYTYTALAATVLIVFLLRDLWTGYVRSDARRLFLEMGLDMARFDPLTSIDLQFANGTAVHDAPSLYKQASSPGLLVYPPSAATLEQMNG